MFNYFLVTYFHQIFYLQMGTHIFIYSLHILFTELFIYTKTNLIPISALSTKCELLELLE